MGEHERVKKPMRRNAWNPSAASERSVGRDPWCLVSTQSSVEVSSPTTDSLSLAFKT